MLVRLGSVFFAVPSIILLIFYGIELSAITNCQQQGQFYDLVAQACTTEQQPFSTFYMRHTLIVNLSLLLATIGALAMCLGMLNRQR